MAIIAIAVYILLLVSIKSSHINICYQLFIDRLYQMFSEEMFSNKNFLAGMTSC